MPTVECDHTDCEKHGIEICIAKRVKWENGQCLEYVPRIGKRMLEQPFKSNCHKANGKYRSNRITKVLK